MAKTKSEEPEAEESGLGRLRQEMTGFLGAQAEKLAARAGDGLTDVTGRLTDIAENGGSLPTIGSRVLQGDSPVKAFVSEKAKDVKDGVVGKAKKTFGGGGKGKRKSGGGKVVNVVEVLDVGVPLRTAYDHWTQYDRFSSFAKGVQDVSMDDETGSNWKVKIGPSSRSFKATVQEQVPDERIVWTSEGAKGTTRGAVSFHELAPSLTRVVLVLEYYPAGFLEKTGNLWRAQGRRVRLDFKNFQRYVTLTDEEPESWRGEIRDGEVVISHEEAMEQEQEQDGEDGEDGEDEDGWDDQGDWEEGQDGDDELTAEEDEDEEPEEDEDEDEDEDEEPEEDEDEDDVEESPPKKRAVPAKRRARRT